MDHKAIATLGFSQLEKLLAVIDEQYNNEPDPHDCKKHTASCCVLTEHGTYIATGFNMSPYGPCVCKPSACTAVPAEITAIFSAASTQNFMDMHYLLMQDAPRTDMAILLSTPIMVIVLKGAGIGTESMREQWETAGRTWVNLGAE